MGKVPERSVRRKTNFEIELGLRMFGSLKSFLAVIIYGDKAPKTIEVK